MNHTEFYMHLHKLDGNVECICGEKFTKWVVNESAHASGLAAIQATCSFCGCVGGQSVHIEKEKHKKFQDLIKRFVEQV